MPSDKDLPHNAVNVPIPCDVGDFHKQWFHSDVPQVRIAHMANKHTIMDTEATAMAIISNAKSMIDLSKKRAHKGSFLGLISLLFHCLGSVLHPCRKLKETVRVVFEQFFSGLNGLVNQWGCLAPGLALDGQL